MKSTANIYIAIIDDDESIRLSMSRLLRAGHFHPVAYSCAEVFLTDVNRPKFACLLLDIQLQGMSGLELGKRLLAAKDTTPIIFITAHDNLEVRELEINCAGYFIKTDSGSEILAAIRRTINKADEV